LFYKKLGIKIVVSLLRESGPWIKLEEKKVSDKAKPVLHSVNINLSYFTGIKTKQNKDVQIN